MRGGKRINSKIKLFIVGALTLLGVLGTAATIYSESTINGISDNIIRFHVIAKSDSDIHQDVKLEVRDSVLTHLTGKMDISGSIDETINIINEEIHAIEEIAKNILVNNGYEAVASAEYGRFAFPTKQYENIELPSGSYNALRITLGSGRGNNWWCVLFPPLCFVDTNGRIDAESDTRLRESLTSSQYHIITSTGNDETPSINFRFRVVEIVQDARQFISGIFG